MRKTLLLLLLGVSLQAQSEFTEFENGLIYSPNAIAKLQEIVGDKNKEFRKCDLTKSFRSIPQTKGLYIDIEASNAEGLIEMLEANISLENFIAKYAPNVKSKLALITKTTYTRYDGSEYIRVSEEPNGRDVNIQEKDWGKSLVNNWIINRRKGKIEGVVYLQSEFKSLELPYQYSRMVQYAECLIDSTTQIHPDDAKRTRRGYRNTESTVKLNELYVYIEKEFGKKEPKLEKELTDLKYKERVSSKKYKKFRKDHRNWKITRSKFIKEELSKKEEFIKLLDMAFNEAIDKQSSNDELENYISKYLSKEKALILKRGRVVVGGCSQDQSPRIHAMNIAQLSAESYDWDVFLRAHLNVMNDRFIRSSDGSYAWADRLTYVKELEVLNINVSDLIYGISFRVKNPSKNHYYSNIRRVGRALSESEIKDKIASDLVEMIKDNDLDDYNRLILFYLYHNFRYNQKDSYTKSHIKYIANLLPEYMRPKIKS
ncbi:hypothetical protein [uncultured Aquimarina sp.]|uniref:hypothetical protein n=1 Tax=uncultured Aquimarina sp. TaxID=575652 RepID=UPI002638B134|nr:hypothetical protein [uncultured Aquimarina sp.]